MAKAKATKKKENVEEIAETINENEFTALSARDRLMPHNLLKELNYLQATLEELKKKMQSN